MNKGQFRAAFSRQPLLSRLKCSPLMERSNTGYPKGLAGTTGGGANGSVLALHHPALRYS